MLKNCLTMMVLLRWRLREGKIFIHSWSGAWRKTEWPKTPHFALKTKSHIFNYKADNCNLPIWKILNFSGKIKKHKLNVNNNETQ